jgi:hypothetical protein
VELLKGMLALDPKKRITATDAVLVGAGLRRGWLHLWCDLLCGVWGQSVQLVEI